MKIIILGAGAIGSLIGYLLRNEDVVLVGNKKHVSAINKNGLVIKGLINKKIKINAINKIKKLEREDIIMLATKAYSIENSLKKIEDKVKKNNLLLIMQNGLGNENIAKKIINCNVVRGLTTYASAYVKPGVIEYNGKGEIFLQKGSISREMLKIFRRPLNVTEVDNINKKVWEKTTINCAINPLTVILKCKNGYLKNLESLVDKIIEECLIIAKKEGFNFNKNKIFNETMKIIEKTKNNKSSMLQDILRGKKTEIDFLNGKIVNFGKKHNLKTPLNELLLNAIKFLEKSINNKIGIKIKQQKINH